MLLAYIPRHAQEHRGVTTSQWDRPDFDHAARAIAPDQLAFQRASLSTTDTEHKACHGVTVFGSHTRIEGFANDILGLLDAE